LANGDKGILGAGFALTTRHQRILWWVFAANFVLGGLGSSGAARALGGALHHSLAGERLANTFDVGMFLELVSQPDVKLFSHSGGIALFAALYFLFLLFVTPGIIAVYLQDRKFSTAEFFGAAGSFFWAFVRLALWSLIPFILVDLLFQLVKALSDYVGARVAADQASFYILVIGSIPVLLLALWVRYWFDLAQARSVSLKDRAMRRNAVHMFSIAIRQAWRGYWAYILSSVFVWIVTIIAVLIWRRVPGRAVWLTTLLLEIVMLTHIFGRLWQKACATTWYMLNPEPLPALPVTPSRSSMPAVPEEIANSAADADTPIVMDVEPRPEPAPSEPETPKETE
jgi:hypothetical protein